VIAEPEDEEEKEQVQEKVKEQKVKEKVQEKVKEKVEEKVKEQMVKEQKAVTGAVKEELVTGILYGRSPSVTPTLAHSHVPERCTCGAAEKHTVERYLIT